MFLDETMPFGSIQVVLLFFIKLIVYLNSFLVFRWFQNVQFVHKMNLHLLLWSQVFNFFYHMNSFTFKIQIHAFCAKCERMQLHSKPNWEAYVVGCLWWECTVKKSWINGEKLDTKRRWKFMLLNGEPKVLFWWKASNKRK